ncbi:Myosin light chain kinase, smooth muscle [Orchesella cincta]|uniref:Myosin light chain kinase, smooth muscle n=1 Tax=Orchesella cincta TaxID=48709 RepID=A0A1D2N7L5_ORCCI|nr:Myosin light chain kinase, smooth muscle [Orchesella cincta]
MNCLITWDDNNIIKIFLYFTPTDDVLFHRFHQKLSDGLMNLGYSLKLAIENKPLSETPTSAHTTLTNLLVEVKEAAMELPLMETTTIPREKTKDEIISDAADGKKSGGEGQSSYEDVLATAILNKVVLNGQKARNKSDSPLSLVDSAVQTDSEMSETSEIVTQKNQYNVQGWVTNLEKRSPQQHSSNLSDDDLSMGTSSSNWSNEGPTHRGSTHQQIVIEEQVEEITTTYESDSDIGHSPPVRNRKLRKSGRRDRSNNTSEVPQTVVTNEDPLFGVDLSNFDKRVPFPEGGVDIISPTEAGVLHENEAQDPKEPQIGAEKASDLSDLSDHVNEDDEDGDYIMSSSDEEKDNKAQDEESTVVDAPQAKNTNGHQVEVITTQIHRPQEKKSSLVEQQINVGKAPPTQPVKQEKVINPVTKVKVKPERKVERGMSFTTIPQDCKVSAGKTAKFVCTIGETSPSYSVAWFFEGALITSEKGKRWIYSAENTHRHFLYIYDVNEKDAGNYHVSVFDHRGNETKNSFKLAVSATEQRRTDPPTFTVLKEIVKASTQEHVLTIPFEISGFPEPYLEIYRNNVEISKLSHVLLEGEGAGKWVLQIRKNETDFSVDGEYVAVAKNKGGMTKVTFQIQHGEGVPTAIAETQKVTKDNLATAPENHAKSLSPQPRPVSAASQVSSIEETLRETSQSMDANQTLIKEDYEALLEWEQSRNIDSSKMTIAEREKLKWQNPVNLPNNPYAPENLAKRIRQRENSGFSLPPSKPGDISVTSSDDERPSVDRLAQNYQKDYYVHGVQPSPSKLPTGPKFPPSMSLPLEKARNKTPTSSKEPSVEKEEVPKEQPVSRKPSFLVNQPVVSESPVEIPKVPLEKRESIREKFEETGRKKPVEMDKVAPLNKRQISSSPTPPPPEIRSSKSPTPSPDRSRQGSVESRSAKKDSAELEAIKLPSVKRLAQQFNKEPSPEETKVKEISKVPPPINPISRNLIKLQDSKSIQQPKPKVEPLFIRNEQPVQPKQNVAPKVPFERQEAQALDTPSMISLDEKRSSISDPPPIPPQPKIPLQRQEAFVIETPSIIPMEENRRSSFSFPKSEKDEIAELESQVIKIDTEDGVNKVPDIINKQDVSESPSLVSEDEISGDEETGVPPPPLPFTPPPPKTPTSEDPIVLLYDAFSEQNNSDNDTNHVDAIIQSPTTPTFESFPSFSRSLSRNSESDQMHLPSIPNSYMPHWARSKSDASIDLDTLQFELRSEEQDHLPPSILPDTPQPASLATTITDDALTETESEYGITDELENLKEHNDRQPFYKTFNTPTASTSTSKRNSWNTTSSFAYSPTNSFRRTDGESDMDNDEHHHAWSENTPSIVPAHVKTVALSSDGNQSESSASESVGKSKGQRVTRSPSRVMSIAAQFETNNSSNNSSLERDKDKGSKSSLKEDKAKDEAAKSSPKPLTRRLTAMEVLATPAASMLAKKAEEDEEEMRRLRRSIVRGARSNKGLKTDPDRLLNETKMQRTQSLTPLEYENKVEQPTPKLVHSLTARSVSREFREGLRLSHPSPPNMNIKVAPKLSPNKENSQESKQEEQNESERETVTITNNSKNSDNKNRQNGEETSSENQNNDMLTSAALNKSKRTASNSILSRAAFWDKRVKDGIVDDDVAIKEFPKVEGVAEKV